MKILVALEDSDSAEVAFREAVRLVRSDRDELILFSVNTEKNAVEAASSEIPPLSAQKLWQQPEKEKSETQPQQQNKPQQKGEDDKTPTRITVTMKQANAYDPSGRKVGLLSVYSEMCRKQNIRHQVVLGVSKNIGLMLCQAVVYKDADCLILGRSRTSEASMDHHVISKFCIENAPCNVMIAKDLRPIVLHDSTVESVVNETEIERKRRMQDETVVEEFSDLLQVRDLEEKERRERIREMFGEEGLRQFEREGKISSTTTSKAKILAELEKEAEQRKKENREAWKEIDRVEEEERIRRIKEEEQLNERERFEREQSGQAAICAEEMERKRRIEEYQGKPREETPKQTKLERINKLEEAERERRMMEGPKLIDRELEIELFEVVTKSA